MRYIISSTKILNIRLLKLFLKIYLFLKSESAIFFFYVSQLTFFFLSFIRWNIAWSYLINIDYKISRPPLSFLNVKNCINIFSQEYNTYQFNKISIRFRIMNQTKHFIVCVHRTNI